MFLWQSDESSTRPILSPSTWNPPIQNSTTQKIENLKTISTLDKPLHLEMHPKNFLIFFFVAVCHSAVSKFQRGKFDTKNNDARSVSVLNAAKSQPSLVSNGLSTQPSAIVTTFKTIVITRNAKIADHDFKMTLGSEEAVATTTTVGTTFNSVQSKKRRNTLYLGPLGGIKSSAISTEFATLVIPNFTTFSLPISTISAN